MKRWRRPCLLANWATHGLGLWVEVEFSDVYTALGSQVSALEATQGQMNGFCGQLLYEYHLEEVASMED